MVLVYFSGISSTTTKLVYFVIVKMSLKTANKQANHVMNRLAGRGIGYT